MKKSDTTDLLNVLWGKENETDPAYISKYNSTCKESIEFLMITNWKGWHYLAVTKLSELIREIMSKHHSDFYCLNCLQFFAR